MNGILCYIGIGSNLGDSFKNCKKAVELIALEKGINLETVSSFYKTEPVGIENQDFFVNAVLEIKTLFSPQNLLKTLLDIEQKLGRERNIKGGPRIIDIDLLFYGQDIITERNLIVPHPEIHKRRFVLEPLCEIASFFVHPSFGISIRGLRDRLADHKSVEKIIE